MTSPLLLMALGALLFAGDALYDPEPPPDAAFVRVINAGPGGAPLEAEVGGKHFDGLEAPGVSAYRVVKAGQRSAKLGPLSVEHSFEAGGFYSLALWSPGGSPALLPLQDAGYSNLSKSLVVFYNLSELGSLDLRTADGAATLVSAVAPGASGSREVNAIEVALAVYRGDEVVKAFPARQLVRGEVTNVVISGPDAALLTPSRTLAD